ncbi:SDR family NAD(P)-dependent oxidoreductase [Geotalea uraniireducens]|uniref:Beta-ketoacyl synthase n=1 Tax=Geotalea uraniireducens (strain Rf4) TaxID=351605 RepID=A5G644_GEOUR|nr:SDR family NAD(P)-dependent oxidoreductase [Geotalea uraniireducens]ABQ27262.1 beta-ketoacyl synthase [Geotalea uraniireducens Rf4]
MQDQYRISSNHPIVRNHAAYGRKLLPGLAYIDMLYQLFRENGHDYAGLELRNLSIHNPLTIPDEDDLEIGIYCEEIKAGRWRIRVEGARSKSRPVETLFITAEMHRVDTPALEETQDLELIKKTADRVFSLGEVYERCRSFDLVHTGFMKAEGTVYQGEKGTLIDISLGDEALSSAEGFMFHPVLIDASAIGSGVVFDPLNKAARSLFLPLCYESFSAGALFKKRCLTLIQNPVSRKKEINYLTMTFFDESGRRIGELKNYAGKLVREAGLIDPFRKDVATSKGPIAPSGNGDMNRMSGTSSTRGSQAELFLQQLVAEKLGQPADQISTQVGYYEMGLNSPTLLEVVAVIGEKLSVQLMPTLLFEYTTIGELAEYLFLTYPDAFGKSPAAQTPSQKTQAASPVVSQPRPKAAPRIDAPSATRSDVAIIGMAGRYPKAKNLDEFWENLKAGMDCITEVPESRWELHRLHGIKSPSGKKMSEWGGFLDDPDCFDPQFFRISPREAEVLDPQERLFLETCWETIEDAGYTPSSLVASRGRHKRRDVGVFAGVMHKDYTLLEARAVDGGEVFPLSLSCALIANRVSYFCNFHGPSIAVDTVCSSSLIAVHLALESIKNGECEVALAGGVNLSLHPYKYLTYGVMDFHSSDGRCHTFGNGGDGYVSAEGVGAVLLKPLHKAIEDGDHIYAVISGSAINHVGAVSGVTVPSPIAHADMIETCVEKTGIDPRTISYVEAHGTGTSLGDPIEIQGLARAYRIYTQDQQYCSIGSVKSNIGHAESAAGISGLHKLLLQLHHKVLVPSLHAEELNSYIDFKKSPFYVQRSLEQWRCPRITENGREVSYPRRAGLSSFGAYGSNAHIILEEYVPGAGRPAAAGYQQVQVLVPLSAKNEERLHAYAVRLLEFLDAPDGGLPRQAQGERESGLRKTMELRIRNIMSGIIHVREEDLEIEQDWNEYGVEFLQLELIKDALQDELAIEIDGADLRQWSSIAAASASLLEHRELLADSEDMPKLPQPASGRELNLTDLAFTLQVGREAMDARLAVVAQSIDELKEKLKGFVQGTEGVSGLFRGQVKRNKEIVDMFTSDDDMFNTVEAWMQKGMFHKLGKLWVNGMDVDWSRLYGEYRPQRIKLPTYPFARERYWVPDTGASRTDKGHRTGNAVHQIHPLLHQNTSNLSEQRFSSSFTGAEFFVNEPVGTGGKVLAAAACLEMVRAAVEEAAVTEEGGAGIRLKNVAWTRPIALNGQPVQVHIGLYLEDSGEIGFEIYSQAEGNQTEPLLHSRGTALLGPAGEAPRVDLEALQARCSRSALNAEQCYEAFRSMGIEYGLGQRGIESMHAGSEEALAKLMLPSGQSDTLERYVLHPSLLDCAFQATIGCGDAACRLALPASVESLELFAPCTSSMWAWARYSEGGGADNKAEAFDVDLCDETGRVCVRMKGIQYSGAETEPSFAADAISQLAQASATAAPEPFELMTFEEVWQEHALPNAPAAQLKKAICFLSDPQSQDLFAEAIPQTTVIFISQGTGYEKQSQSRYRVCLHDPKTYQEAFSSIREEHGDVDAVLYLWPLEDPERITDYASIVSTLHAVASAKLKTGRFLLAGRFGNELERCYLESWIGFERSLGLVLPTTQTAVLLEETTGRDLAAEMKTWAQRIRAEYAGGKVRSILYRDGKRYAYRIRPTLQEPGVSLVRAGGTYLITGGCGGLGFLFAADFARKNPVNLVLTGRSPLDEAKKSRIQALEDLGSKVWYLQADVCDVDAMKEGLNRAQERFGRIHGVIHSAGIEDIQSVLEKDMGRFEKVLAPKITGTLVLDELLREEPLDFICYFSSSAAILGDFGSCDYSIANRFQMSYTQYRNGLEKQGLRKGRAVAINWPLWKDGGMSIGDSEKTELYLKSSGQRTLETAEGLEVFERCLSVQDAAQHLVLVGQRSRVHRFLGLNEEVSRSNTVSAAPQLTGRSVEMQGLSVEQCLESDLKKQIATLMKIPISRVDEDTNLADFGFDSITLMELAALLTERFGIETTPSVFFAYSTLGKLVRYFASEHRAAIEELYREDAPKPAARAYVPAARHDIPAATQTQPQVRSKRRFGSIAASPGLSEPIAIVGMSGRFPQAGSVEEFWKNIVDGRVCITEVPSDRWDWRRYYTDRAQEAGKTNSRWGGFVPDVDCFDPLFFEISPKEAGFMDPGQRLFLEEAWHALEDAGYMGARIRGTACGVYVGVEEGEYGYLSGNQGLINSNQNATLSARIAYMLDLKGPNLALTAACSSGLVAVHQACQALRQGECEMALAGGISLLLSPSAYLGLSKFDMLSPDGTCRVFDRDANGLVPAEAVAAVVLKPLSKAVADKDRIYGCIKASGVNYDGKTNGIIAPTPLSQAELIKSIYAKSRIAPDDIQYVLAHSTGSKLSDPIEFQALTSAFRSYTDKEQYCALGSIKPLVGHTFAASGLVNLIGMVMAMNTHTIPGMRHYETSNGYIRFEGSPFVPCRENQAWTSKNGGPRLGAISTTGINGTNAHAVIEEYIVPQNSAISVPASGPALFVLSAKTEVQLRSYAENIKSWIESHEDADLADIAYTLQMGREAMEYRLAFPAGSLDAVLRALTGFIGNDPSSGVFSGRVQEGKNEAGLFSSDENGKALLETWIQKARPAKIAEAWANGLNFDWSGVYGAETPRTISLPAYPFARERYWTPEAERLRLGDSGNDKIHPLLHQNTSDFSEQRFSSTFTGEEFFLTDHVVQGRKVLPGVAYLEMARAALEQAAGAEEGNAGVRLKNVVWARPIAVEGQPVRVHISLIPLDTGEITYEIYSDSQEDRAEPLVHGQGAAELLAACERSSLDIQALQAECTKESLTPSQCYETFKQMGIEYGPGHRGIEEAYVGEGKVLAKLSLSSSESDARGQFVFHPGLTDSALQPCLLLTSSGERKSVLPFAVRDVEIFSSCTSVTWSWVRLSDNGATGDKEKFDIDLCDETGLVCASLRGLSVRGVEGKTDSTGSSRGYAVVSDLDGNLHAAALAFEGNTVREKAEHYFKQLLSSAIGLPASRIETDAALEKYGIDSIMVLQMTNQLEKTFGSLPKTLFFEYRNIREVTSYFLASYPDQMKAALGIQEKPLVSHARLQHLAFVEGAAASPDKRGRSRLGSVRATSRNEKELAQGAFDIAVIGVSGRYPQAGDLQEFWKNLREGRDSITEIPKDRWDHGLYFDADKSILGKVYSKWGGFLDGVDLFDPLFFNISPREAQIIDPQERLFLECVYETMEDAGYTKENLSVNGKGGARGNVGVYVGVMYDEYQLYGAQEQIQGRPISCWGVSSSIANRVSYFCNFQGPSIAVDTMCSSSLTAIHFACQGIRRGECEVAIAGGVNVSIHPNKYLMLSQSGFLSSKGKCESFGKGGDGYVPGEGVGALLLKPVSKAIADGDHIYGVIKGTSINHGGKTNGYTVPNPQAQAGVVVGALQEAGIDPRSISYIEAHGTGTSLGDPIEIAGLTKAFREYTNDKEFCAIGSVKSNIGHCESAAGIAGVTKVLLQFAHGELAPSLHAQTLNPHIDFGDTPFVVQQELAEWKRPLIDGRELPRRAGISAFGAGGANAHVVMEEYQVEKKGLCTISKENPAVIVLSAKNDERLKERVKDLSEWVERAGYGDEKLADIAYTLQVGREEMEERLGFTVSTIQELEEKLNRYLKGEVDSFDLYRGQAKRDKETFSQFAIDEDLQKAVDNWISKRKYEKLLDFWVRGLSINWNKIYDREKPVRISLPAYPFAREKYWIPILKTEMNKRNKEYRREAMILTKEWQRTQIESDSVMNDVFLIILGTTNTTELATMIFKEKEGIQVIIVVQGTSVEKGIIATDFYVSDNGEELYRRIKEKGGESRLLGLIDITALDPKYEESLDLEAGKLRLLQKLIENDREKGFKLLQVTHLLNDFRNHAPSMQGARLAGLYRMLSAEYKEIRSATMDSDLGLNQNDIEKLESQIEKELMSSNKGKVTECCYRNEERYEPVLAVKMTEDEIRGAQTAIRYEQDDVILITGGTRGIGRAIAGRVVSQGVRKLVILGKEKLPPVEEWKNEAGRKEKIETLQSYVEVGVRVQYYDTPLTDEEAVNRMVTKVREELGEITGVFHCAGMAGKDPAFTRKPIGEIEDVCAPKIKGVVHLHQALRKEKLKFSILFSSVSSILPALSVGQSDYAMANSYMDYFAMSRTGEGNIKSVQWPAWREAGMVATTDGVKTPVYINSGLESISNREGMELLDVIREAGPNVSLPCVVNPERFKRNELLKTEIEVKKTELKPSRKTTKAVTWKKTVGKELNVEVREWLKEVFKQELRLNDAQLDETRPFDEYGVDSIVIAQIVQTLQKKISKPISPSVVLENKTLNELTKYFVDNHAQELKDLLGVEAEAVYEEVEEENDEYDNDYRVDFDSREEEIAIVGISCRFPDSPTKDAYWKLLTEGKKAIREVSESRWESNGRRDYGGWVDDIDSFDPEFFKLKENDAMIMDPQARLILEESLKAVYDAGYESKDITGQRVGVYVGGRAQVIPDMEKILEANNPILGIGQNYLATNISRFFNITGPSLVLDTACSSGLTAISMASDTLKRGRIDMAMVGAVSLILNQFTHRLFEARNILSKNGEFKIFENQSEGEVLGEGAGLVLMKRLSDAVRDGNKIYGVIKAIAVNNDGRTLGPGSPNIDAQKEVMKEALELSRKKPEEVDYIEVNGGGSPVVDTIEIKALSEIYRLDDNKLKPCAVGSIKPNIGHLLLTSGLAGFIRCMLSLEEKKIPPFLSAMEPFEHYDFTASRIGFNRECTDWLVAPGMKRIAAQNSFPDGGTNCHVIMEEFVPEGNYTQRLFSLPAPVLNKRTLGTGVTLSTATNRDSNEERETRDKAAHSSVHNVWGEFDAKYI